LLKIQRELDETKIILVSIELLLQLLVYSYIYEQLNYVPFIFMIVDFDNHFLVRYIIFFWQPLMLSFY